MIFYLFIYPYSFLFILFYACIHFFDLNLYFLNYRNILKILHTGKNLYAFLVIRLRQGYKMLPQEIITVTVLYF